MPETYEFQHNVAVRCPTMPPGITLNDRMELGALLGRQAAARSAMLDDPDDEAAAEAEEASANAVMDMGISLGQRVGPDGIGSYLARDMRRALQAWAAAREAASQEMEGGGL